MAQAFVAAVKELGQEESFICVQCGDHYTDSFNGEGACSFHVQSASGRSAPSCCGSYQPCKQTKHRAKHHCEYPYSTFFKRAWDVLNYTDTVDYWARVEETDFEANTVSQQVYVGRLLRWASRTSSIAENILFLSIGRISSYHFPYWFQTYTEADLDEIGKAGKTDIFRNSDSTTEYSLARWIINDHMVTGIHLEAKAKTSDTPTVTVVNFSAFPLEKGEVKQVSVGGIKEAKPESEYQLPAPLEIGQKLPDALPRKSRDNFPTQGSLKIKVKLGELAVNQRAMNEVDMYAGYLMVLNLDKTEPLPILDVKCEWRLVGNPEWQPVEEFQVENTVPFTCDPLQPTPVYFMAHVPTPGKTVRWFDRSYVNRRQPLRLRFIFEDLSGNHGSQVIEHCFTPFRLNEKREGDLLFLKADNPDLWERDCVRVTKDSNSVICVESNSYDVDKLRGIVYKASKSGETEQELCGGSNWKAYALVDLNCKRVYAVKVMIWTKVSASVGYVPLEAYGHVDEVKPNKPAVEKQPLPDIETDPGTEYVQDDDLDDTLIPVDAVAGGQSGGAGGAGGVLTFDQNSLEVFTTMNSNLARMADSMQKLDSVEKSMTRLAEAFENLTKVLSEKK